MERELKKYTKPELTVLDLKETQSGKIVTQAEEFNLFGLIPIAGS
jgi:hypothetical protein